MKEFDLKVVDSNLRKLSGILAILGGCIMMMLATITVASIVGRNVFGQSIAGDYEITELGLAISVFLFLPECYFLKGHVVVDIFSAAFGRKGIVFLDKMGDFLFFIISAFFVIRMSLSGLESFEYLEQTMILELKSWWAYAVGVFCFSICMLSSMNQLFLQNEGELCE